MKLKLIILAFSFLLLLPFFSLATTKVDEVARQAKRLQMWQEEQTQNGPTGIIETSRGSFTVVRFGTMIESHPLYMNWKLPEDVASIEFLEPCCDARLILRNGKTEVWHKQGMMMYRTGLNSYSGYGYDPGMPVVVKDSTTGKLREEYFPKLDGIRRITFDPPSKWKGKLAVPLDASGQQAAPTVPLRAPVTPRPPVKTPVIPVRAQVKPQVASNPLRIGEKVCSRMDATMREYQGFAVLGQPSYANRDGVATITAFVERIEGSRFQLRTGGVSFRRTTGSAERIPMDSFEYNGVQLIPGMLFWDEATPWQACM